MFDTEYSHVKSGHRASSRFATEKSQHGDAESDHRLEREPHDADYSHVKSGHRASSRFASTEIETIR